MAPAIKTAVKLAIACFCVGLVLYWIDFSALDVLRSVSEAVHYVVDFLVKDFAKLADIMLLGAIVVLPIAFVRFGLSRLKRRRGPPPPPRSRQA